MERLQPISAKRADRWAYPMCLLISALLLLVCTKSSPLYPLNDWVDVNIYFTIGKGLLRGMVPYRDLYDQKGPVVFLLYGLCSLVSGKSFLGVWLLEIFSFSAFLYSMYRLICLWATDNALAATAVLGSLLLPSMAVSHGASLEQICLPIFGYGLYSITAYYRGCWPEKPKLSMIAANGLLAGLLLFAKFNLLAFYFAWMGVLAIALFVRGEWKHSLLCCGAFLLCMAAVGIPWLIYFGSNGALGDFFHYYFYSNLFGYSYIDPPVLPNTLLAVVKGVGATFLRNYLYSPLIVLGFLWVSFGRIAKGSPVERINLWALGAFTALGVFMGGQGYRYYGIPLMTFAALGLVPLLLLWNKRIAPRLGGKGMGVFARYAPPVIIAALGVGLSLLCSDNVYLLGASREETPQARFAAKMEACKREEPLTMLCRAFPDSGFYLAADMLPQCRFFTSTNVPLQEIADEQVRQVEAGIPEFVITRDRPDPPGAGYGLVDTAGLYYEDEIRTYHLYQREEDFYGEP